MEEVGENMGRMVGTEGAQDCTVEGLADQTEVVNTITRRTKSTREYYHQADKKYACWTPKTAEEEKDDTCLFKGKSTCI